MLCNWCLKECLAHILLKTKISNEWIHKKFWVSRRVSCSPYLKLWSFHREWCPNWRLKHIEVLAPCRKARDVLRQSMRSVMGRCARTKAARYQFIHVTSVKKELSFILGAFLVICTSSQERVDKEMTFFQPDIGCNSLRLGIKEEIRKQIQEFKANISVIRKTAPLDA